VTDDPNGVNREIAVAAIREAHVCGQRRALNLVEDLIGAATVTLSADLFREQLQAQRAQTTTGPTYALRTSLTGSKGRQRYAVAYHGVEMGECDGEGSPDSVYAVNMLLGEALDGRR
jgi:hypothetical protein